MITFLSLLAVAKYLLSWVHPQDQISLLCTAVFLSVLASMVVETPSSVLSRECRDQVLSLDTQSNLVLHGEKASCVTVRLCAEIPPTSAHVWVSQRMTLAEAASELLQAEATSLLSPLAATQNSS